MAVDKHTRFSYPSYNAVHHLMCLDLHWAIVDAYVYVLI